MSIAVKTDTGWQVLGVGEGGGVELPGVGGWATITSVWNGSGTKPNRYSYTDGIDWVAFEWTADGSVTTQTGGLVDALIVSGGASGVDKGGQGNYLDGMRVIEVSNPITVGQGGIRGDYSKIAGKSSILGPWTCPESAGNITHPRSTRVVSAIVGEDRTYSDSNSGTAPLANTGHGTQPSQNAASGVVIVRVPAAQAAGVDPSEYTDVP